MSEARGERRTFVVGAEVPGLLWGALRGEAVTLRRILGARRSGRWGIGLALAGLALATPSIAGLPVLIALHLVLALYVVIARRAALGLGPAQELTLALWTTAPLLLVASLARPFTDSLAPALAAILLGHLLVWRGLRTGLV